MGLLSIFEITTTFAQYLGIITSVDIPWPESWQYYIAYVGCVDAPVPCSLSALRCGLCFTAMS